MKTLLFTLILHLAVQAHAQEKLSMIDGYLGVRKVIEVPGKSKPEIYLATKTWINKSFKDPEKVTILNDTLTGMIKLKYVADYKTGLVRLNFYNCISIDYKDEKARFTFNEISEVQQGYTLEAYVYKKDGTFRPMYKDLVAEIEAEADKMIRLLTAAMSAKDTW